MEFGITRYCNNFTFENKLRKLSILLLFVECSVEPSTRSVFKFPAQTRFWRVWSQSPALLSSTVSTIWRHALQQRVPKTLFKSAKDFLFVRRHYTHLYYYCFLHWPISLLFDQCLHFSKKKRNSNGWRWKSPPISSSSNNVSNCPSFFKDIF